jgi:hypothetical protein
MQETDPSCEAGWGRRTEKPASTRATDGPNPAVNAAKSWLTDATQL